MNFHKNTHIKQHKQIFANISAAKATKKNNKNTFI